MASEPRGTVEAMTQADRVAETEAWLVIEGWLMAHPGFSLTIESDDRGMLCAGLLTSGGDELWDIPAKATRLEVLQAAAERIKRAGP
jgi:hypothetical protein